MTDLRKKNEQPEHKKPSVLNEKSEFMRDEHKEGDRPSHRIQEMGEQKQKPSGSGGKTAEPKRGR